MTLQELFGFKPLKVFESRHEKNDSLPQANRAVGLELEIENFNPLHEQKFPGFHFEADGSLRNSDEGIGIEAITAPTPIGSITGLLTVFYKKFGITERNFTERCSTHVHVNVMDLTPEQLASVALLYQTTERLLFEFIGNNRDESIFCVPWSQSGLTYNYVSKFLESPQRVRDWQKYSALNLIPAGNQGSIEFRHLYGTCDTVKIQTWLCIIGCLFERALSKPLLAIQEDICGMNTVSNYREWLYGLFGPYAEHFVNLPNYEQALFRGVVDCKVMLTSESKEEIKITDTEAFLNQYRDLLRQRPQAEPVEEAVLQVPDLLGVPTFTTNNLFVNTNQATIRGNPVRARPAPIRNPQLNPRRS